jgi:hypothetical protein
MAATSRTPATAWSTPTCRAPCAAAASGAAPGGPGGVWALLSVGGLGLGSEPWPHGAQGACVSRASRLGVQLAFRAARGRWQTLALHPAAQGRSVRSAQGVCRRAGGRRHREGHPRAGRPAHLQRARQAQGRRRRCAAAAPRRHAAPAAPQPCKVALCAALPCTAAPASLGLRACQCKRCAWQLKLVFRRAGALDAGAESELSCAPRSDRRAPGQARPWPRARAGWCTRAWGPRASWTPQNPSGRAWRRSSRRPSSRPALRSRCGLYH